MANMDFLGTGWKYPIAITKEDDKIAISEGEDSIPESTKSTKIAISEGEDSISESIFIILGTAKGERVMRPDFGCGINELVFAPNNTSTATMLTIHVKEALLQWEPRIEVLNVFAAPDQEEGNRLNINIEYMVKTSNTKRNLVYPFYLERSQD